jgi:hypothetical protein
LKYFIRKEVKTLQTPWENVLKLMSHSFQLTTARSVWKKAISSSSVVSVSSAGGGQHVLSLCSRRRSLSSSFINKASTKKAYSPERCCKFSNFQSSIYQISRGISSAAESSEGDKDDDDGKPSLLLKDEEYDPKEDAFFTQDVAYGSKVNKGKGDPVRPFFDPPEVVEDEEEYLSPPTNCCRTGCPNCVWLEYVEKLSKKYSNPELSKEKILKDLDEMDDQSIKAFIMMELRVKGLI